MNQLVHKFDIYSGEGASGITLFELLANLNTERALSYLKERPLTQSNRPSSNDSGTTFKKALYVEAPVFEQLLSFKSPRVTRSISEQEFEGVVLDVRADSFFARLIDLTGGQPDEEAEIPFSEISVDDRPLVKPGSLFSWNIGLVERDRQIRRESEIRFRRIFSWSDKAVSEAKAAASHTKELLGWG